MAGGDVAAATLLCTKATAAAGMSFLPMAWAHHCSLNRFGPRFFAGFLTLALACIPWMVVTWVVGGVRPRAVAAGEEAVAQAARLESEVSAESVTVESDMQRVATRLSRWKCTS